MTDGDIDAVMIRAASTAMGFQFWGFGLNKPLVHRRAVIMSICCAMQQHLSLALRLFFCRSVSPRFIFSCCIWYVSYSYAGISET